MKRKQGFNNSTGEDESFDMGDFDFTDPDAFLGDISTAITPPTPTTTPPVAPAATPKTPWISSDSKNNILNTALGVFSGIFSNHMNGTPPTIVQTGVPVPPATGLSTGAILGIVAGIAAVGGIIFFIVKK